MALSQRASKLQTLLLDLGIEASIHECERLIVLDLIDSARKTNPRLAQCLDDRQPSPV